VDDTTSIWAKVDLDEYLAAQAAARGDKTPAEEEEPKTLWQRTTNKIYWWTLKAVAVAFWIYVPAKLFVGDVDRWVVQNVDPSLMWILDFRFFIFLGLLAVALLVFRRWIYLGAIIFILVFPLLVAFFYVPRFLSRQRTWIPTIGLLNALWVTLRSIRFTVVAVFAFSTASVIITIDAVDALQAVAIGVLMVLWAALLARACIAAVKPVSFIRAQQSAITRIQASKLALNLAAPAETHMRPEVVKLSKAEVDAMVMQASGAVCLYGAGYFLADQLERYRKSGAAVIFGVVGVALLFLEAIVVFTMVNFGIYHLEREQFSYAVPPTFATFVRYTLNSLFPGDINALQPVGDWATWVSIYAGVSVGIIVLTLVVALVFSVRSGREDAAATESIAKMRRKSDDYAATLVSEYRLPLNDLIARLMDMGGVINLWFRFVSDRIGDFRQEAASEDS